MTTGDASSDPAALPRCPVCTGLEGSDLYGGYCHDNAWFDLRRCRQCDSVFVVDPMQTDYSEHTTDVLSYRDYVELNAAVDIIASDVMNVIAGRRPGRLIDIGCGFGFGADAARRLAGWEVIGIEPSSYGQRGAAALGLDIRHDFLTPDHPLARQTFDAVFSSEVIEHVDDPRAFLSLARTMLAPGGVLVIGTPDAATLDEPIGAEERLAVLSPGAHLFLMSEKAMRMLLEELGFRYIDIRRRGLSIVALASDTPIETQALNPVEVGRDYIRAVLAGGVSDPSLRVGLAFRLFRYLIDLGDLDAARLVLAELPPVSPDFSTPITALADYMRDQPACIGPLAYYRAMLKLNGDQDFAGAAALFTVAHLLNATKVRLEPQLAVTESHLVWASIYHAGLAWRLAGNEPLARGLWHSILTIDDHAPEPWRSLALQRME